MEEAILEFEKKGIAWHIDTSSTVWTLMYNSKLANQIVRLVAIAVKCFAELESGGDIFFVLKLRGDLNNYYY